MKYEVGQKVRIVSKPVKGNWVEPMNKWCGKVMTISGTSGNLVDYGICYRMKEDNEFWAWNEHMIAGLVNTQEIHITVKGNETHAVLKEDGKLVKRSVAKCHSDDEFDFETGARIAIDRLFKRDFKDGDYAILKTDEIVSKLKIGSFVKIIEVNHPVATVSGYHELSKKKEIRSVCLTDLEPANITDDEYEEQFKKTYNGKVVCVDSNHLSYITGKIYQFENGQTRTESGAKVPSEPVYSFDEWKKYSNAEWLEIVED